MQEGIDCNRYDRVEFAAVGMLYGKRFNFAGMRRTF